VSPISPRRCTVQFLYPELPASRQRYWLVIESGRVDLCQVDPGFDVDLYVECSLRTMTMIWMGLTGVQAELDAGRLELSGDKALARSIQEWLGLSTFAKEKNRRAA
jgi:hypothetical protein